ncbi:hypothetical protein [Metallosphaera hakonensis]|uniref:Uncharacterized protein n=1 Tax=Metallosphaera hakonensis JCM 8857 = DSM 7519 TaxID=1293036 RepID=A0A2U9IW01_9CREN|nr:hypothetical protein [Metallosphaera hakonensis]AWS00217.1 hypothetical protein DFR87_11565 [Metallosphaera hakonensis JCM 8857 = DSM 7519]
MIVDRLMKSSVFPSISDKFLVRDKKCPGQKLTGTTTVALLMMENWRRDGEVSGWGTPGNYSTVAT